MVVITIMYCTEIWFCSLSMRIVFNGISQDVLRWYFANPTCFCKYLSYGFKSGLNRMVLCSMIIVVGWSIGEIRFHFFFSELQEGTCDQFCWTMCVFKALFIACSLITPCKNSLTSSSVDDSVKLVVTARTEFCSIPLRLPEDDALLLFSSASFLVCIASTAFVFPSSRSVHCFLVAS